LSISRRDKAAAVAAVVAVVFGIATLGAGTGVLSGTDPGYTVFRPLLLFNTTMGLFYVAVGLLSWTNRRLGLFGAAGIAALNLLALCTIAYLYTPGGAIASTSIQAMVLRTVVWVALLGVLAYAESPDAGKRKDA
jgi:hypothetical protein